MSLNTSFTSLLMSLALIPFSYAEKPNVVIIFADDMGYGDVQAFNPKRGKIKTPHMDAIAAQGMIFTDAHTSSSVCTPSRYSLMTGRYCWRTSLQQHVTRGYDAPLIPESRLTIASLLKNQGYNTAMIGKWHIGLTMPTVDNAPITKTGLSNVDWSGEIKGGPYDLGFDYFYGISASLDMAPYIYIENNKFVGAGTVIKGAKMKNGIARKGAADVDFEAIEVLDKLAEKSVEFINKQSKDTPFFAYIPLPSPHTPIIPAPEWQGKSGLGDYADFMMQTDAFVGTISKALNANGFSENTLFIVSSDNGCSNQADFDSLNKQGHYPSAQFRGSKADLWDGGHRVPFLVKWPASVKAGSSSNETICLTDIMATLAELTEAGQLPANAGEDSVSFLPALSGREITTSRRGIIHHSISGHFAYREGKWKLLLAKGSGGWTAPKEKDVASMLKAQLYDMEADPGETTNLYTAHPEVVASLLENMTDYINSGRSTDGALSKNDHAEIKLWKSENSK